MSGRLKRIGPPAALQIDHHQFNQHRLARRGGIVCLIRQIFGYLGRRTGRPGRIEAVKDDTELLIGLGISYLSMSAVAIPVVRAEVAATRLAEATRFAAQVLALTSVEDVKRQLRKRFEGRRALELYLAGHKPPPAADTPEESV